MKELIKPIFVVLLFIVWQLVASFGGVIAELVMHPEIMDAIKSGEMTISDMITKMPSDTLALTLIVSGILTIVSVFALKMVNCKAVINPSVIKWNWTPMIMVGAFFGIIASDLLVEWFPLKNNLEEQFMALSKSFWGVAAIAVVGPIVEEFTFREAIIGHLVRHKVNVWVAIFLSAICFGLIHGNPIQIPFAIIVGVIFGVVYAKTGNILLTSIIHIINNGLGVLQMNLLKEEDMDITYKELLGNADIPLIVVLSVLCIFILGKFWNNYKPIYI